MADTDDLGVQPTDANAGDYGASSASSPDDSTVQRWQAAMADAGQGDAPAAAPSDGGGWLGAVGGFAKGFGEGAWDAGKGMVQGVGAMAEGAYGLATSADARQKAADTIAKDAHAVGDFAQTALTDPSKAAGQVGDAVSGAWDSVSTAYQQAKAEGHGAEFLGKLAGQGTVLVGTAFIPGGAEAEAAGVAGDLGRVASLAGDAAKAGDVAADVGKVTTAASDAGKAADVGATTDAAAAAAGGAPKGARGPASSREFDPAQAGGPIEPKSLDDVHITHAGVDQVQAHLSRFGEDPFNDAMLSRQRAIADGKLAPTVEDKAFHAHELDERQRYANLGFKDGVPSDPDAGYALWNNTHTAALEDYGMSEIARDSASGQVRSTLYHPSCDPRLLPDGWTPPPGYPFDK